MDWKWKFDFFSSNFTFWNSFQVTWTRKNLDLCKFMEHIGVKTVLNKFKREKKCITIFWEPIIDTNENRFLYPVQGYSLDLNTSMRIPQESSLCFCVILQNDTIRRDDNFSFKRRQFEFIDTLAKSQELLLKAYFHMLLIPQRWQRIPYFRYRILTGPLSEHTMS